MLAKFEDPANAVLMAHRLPSQLQSKKESKLEGTWFAPHLFDSVHGIFLAPLRL
jgi:hypothetical protein